MQIAANADLPHRNVSIQRIVHNEETGVYSTEIVNVKYVKIHVDFLNEKECIKFREQMMTETGKPGEYRFPHKFVDVPDTTACCSQCDPLQLNMTCSECSPIPTRKQMVFEVPEEHKHLF